MKVLLEIPRCLTAYFSNSELKVISKTYLKFKLRFKSYEAMMRFLNIILERLNSSNIRPNGKTTKSMT